MNAETMTISGCVYVMFDYEYLSEIKVRIYGDRFACLARFSKLRIDQVWRLKSKRVHDDVYSDVIVCNIKKQPFREDVFDEPVICIALRRR